MDRLFPVGMLLLAWLSPAPSSAGSVGLPTTLTLDQRSGGDVFAGADGSFDEHQAVDIENDTLAAERAPTHARLELHTTTSLSATTVTITSRGSCRSATELTGDQGVDSTREGISEGDYQASVGIPRPATYSISGSVTNTGPPQHGGNGGNNHSEFTFARGGETFLDVGAGDTADDSAGTSPIALSGTLAPGRYSFTGSCKTQVPRIADALGTRDTPLTSGTWSFTVTVTLEPCGADEACDEFVWKGGASGAFADPQNWDPGGAATEGVPTFVDGERSDTGIFEDRGTVVLDLAASGARAPAPRAVSRSMGELVMRGPQSLDPVGGTLFLDDLDPSLPERSLRIGGGTLLLDQGGIQARHVSVGFEQDGGALEVVGPGGFFTSLGRFGIGGDRSGDVLIRNGSSVSTAETVMGEGGGTGTATATGAGTLWQTGNLAVGYQDDAGLTIENGAHVESANAFVDCRTGDCVGLHGDARARAELDGAGSHWGADQLAIGPKGKVSVTNGGSLTVGVGGLQIGTAGGEADCIAGEACLDVAEGTVTTPAIDVGAGGPGKMRIGSLGRVGGPGVATVGAGALVPGELIVTGPSNEPQLQMALSVGVAAASHGTLRLEDGALVEAEGASAGGDELSAFGLIEVQGGSVLRIAGANPSLDLGGEGDGVVTTGELALDGGAVDLVDAAMVVHPTGLVSGTGSIEGTDDSSVTNDGEIDCGVTINALYVQGATGAIVCPQPAPPQPASQPLQNARAGAGSAEAEGRKKQKPLPPPAGPLVVNGDTTLDGTLVLQFMNGYAPGQGDAFDLLEVSGNVTGSFANVVVRGLAPGAQFAQDLTAGKLILTAQNDTTALPTVSLKAKPTLKESKAKGGKVKLSRSGDVSAPLSVSYRVRGTATNGVDYVLLPGSFEIPAGKRSATLLVKPFSDGEVEGTESLELEVVPGDDYTPSLASKVAISLVDAKSKRK